MEIVAEENTGSEVKKMALWLMRNFAADKVTRSKISEILLAVSVHS